MNNNIQIETNENENGVNYRYYKWVDITKDECKKIHNEYVKKINNGECPSKPNLLRKPKYLTVWKCVSDYDDILPYLQYLKNKIWGELCFIGVRPYSHNLVGLYLEQIEKHYGHEEVVKLIKYSPLKDLGWSYK